MKADLLVKMLRGRVPPSLLKAVQETPALQRLGLAKILKLPDAKLFWDREQAVEVPGKKKLNLSWLRVAQHEFAMGGAGRGGTDHQIVITDIK